MIFVDTSVWIQYFRGSELDLIRKINGLLDEDQIALAAPVWIELLAGARQIELQKFKRIFYALPRFYPTESCWNSIEDWVEKARKEGYRFSIADLLIAAIVKENNARLLTLDKDFHKMTELKWIHLESIH